MNGKSNKEYEKFLNRNLFSIKGNTLMNHEWKHLALYHYSPAPTLTSLCSVCGLRPSANKALYVKTKRFQF
jgi:hypothetical protein